MKTKTERLIYQYLLLAILVIHFFTSFKSDCYLFAGAIALNLLHLFRHLQEAKLKWVRLFQGRVTLLNIPAIVIITQLYSKSDDFHVSYSSLAYQLFLLTALLSFFNFAIAMKPDAPAEKPQETESEH
jgi:hypothetical protein